MTERSSDTGHNRTFSDHAGSDIHIDTVFEANDVGVYEKQRRIDRYLSQETRHHILQVILGHPTHLPSLTELDYYIPKSRSAIHDQLESLQEHHIVEKYVNKENRHERGLPADFWGLSEFGLSLLDEYKYLRGVPVMRVAHEHTHKTEQVKRHEDAPRPELLQAVRDALEYDEPDRDEFHDHRRTIEELRDATVFADAAPPAASSQAVGDNTDEDEQEKRTLEELL